MLSKRLAFCLVGAVVAMLLVSQAFSAGGGRGGGRAGGRGGPGAVQPRGQRRGAAGQDQLDPEQMRARMQQMMNERIKQRLGATDEQWKTIQPRLQKVIELSRQLGSFGRGFAQRGPGGFRGRAPQDRPQGRGATSTSPRRQLTAVEKAAQELQEVLASETAKAEDIKAKLAAFRTARDKAKKDLAKAQAELKQVVTPRQEAALVLMGQLD